MNANSRQVYTCFSSADNLFISHTVSILLFLCFFSLIINGGGWWVQEGGGCPDMLFFFFFSVKVSLKPNSSRLHPDVHTFVSPRQRWREMCKSSMFSLEWQNKTKMCLKKKEKCTHITWIMTTRDRRYLSLHRFRGRFSLHLSLLTVLLQFLLLLQGPVLLLAGLPASLPSTELKVWW